MAYISAAPRCFIDVYPYEGGQYTVSGNSVSFLNVSVNKSIGNGGQGQFQLELAPGGPNGVNARPTWSEVFTPFSLVVIGMRRGGRSSITMVGFVVTTTEVMRRDQSGVKRIINVVGEDFTRIFSTFCYYDLTYLLGQGKGSLGTLGLPSFVAGALQGSPDQVGSAWYNKIMAGPGSIMASTAFAYQGNRPTFFQLMATWFQAYPNAVSIPTMASFIADEGSWLQKFLTFFPPYFYEFFIQTAPIGYYPAATQAGTPIAMNGFPSVSPTLVARVSPLPFLVASGSATNPTYTMDLTAWNALTNYTIDDSHGPMAESLSYSEAEVRNFYVFAPTWMATSFGASNGSISPFQLMFSQWADVASIHRYGFRPNNVELKWFADPTGSAAQALAAKGQNLNDLVGVLSLRPVAFHEPTPFMLSGSMEMELRPDILPGNTFTFAPYRDGVLWTFYIDAISHSMSFGGRAYTTLVLSRGLPQSVYQDIPLLTALHTGNAQRLNGQLAMGIPAGLGASLSPVNPATVQSIMAGASPLFGAPRN